MKASRSILLLAALSISSCGAVYAGPQSLLDPYASVQAPSNKAKATKPSAPKNESPKGPARSALSSLESEDSAKQEEQAEKPSKTKAEKKEKKEKNSAPASASQKPENSDGSEKGVVSGIKDIQSSYVKTFKAAGSGLVNGTKAAGAKMADGTKKMRDGVAHGAKSSGQVFMKGARAIGHGFKLPGSKAKDGASSAGSKVAVAPKKANHEAKAGTVSSGEETIGQAKNEAPAEKVLDDAKFPGKALEPLSTKPLAKGNSAGPGVFGRTIGKLNVFGHGKKQTAIPPARTAASDPNRPFPN